MPIPKIKNGEEKGKFVSRCMRDSSMKKEYEHKQRLGICMSRTKTKTKTKSSKFPNIDYFSRKVIGESHGI